MNYFKRALASITRKKGKSFILFAVIFILGNVIAGAIAIQQATGNVENKIKQAVGVSATITPNYDLLMKEEDETIEPAFASQDLKIIKQVGELPQVAYFDYSDQDYQNTKKIKIAEMDEEQGGGSDSYLNLVGGNQAEIADVKKGRIKIEQGRTFTQEEVESGKRVALISKKMAEANDVKVGDKLVIDQFQDFDAFSEEGSKGENGISVDLAVEVIGTFIPAAAESKKSTKQEDQFMQSMMDTELLNTIYLPNALIAQNRLEIMQTIYKKDKNFYEEFYGETTPEEYQKMNSFYQPFFMIKEPEQAEAFREDAQALMGKYDKVILSSDQYDDVAGPLNQMSKLAKIVLLVAIGASLVIVSLVVLLFLRDRKHELGVYLSLGEKRGKVIGQIVIEVLAIALVALSLALVSGNGVAKSVSNSMIASEVKKEQEQEQQGDFMDYEQQILGGKSVSQEDVLDAYEVKLTPQFIGAFYVVGLLTIAGAVVVPLIYIVRLNPKKILM